MLPLGLAFVLWSNYQEEREKEGRGGILGRVNVMFLRIDEPDKVPLLKDSTIQSVIEQVA